MRIRKPHNNKKNVAAAAAAAAGKGENEVKTAKLKGAERSAYFARREAAKILRTVLEGDANRRALASIKTLVYHPSVRNKKATFALICQTLKHLPIINDVLKAASILNTKWKKQQELVYIIVYDILFGQGVPLVGDAEKYLMRHKDPLHLHLKKVLSRKNVTTVKELFALQEVPDVSLPRNVRVNTLKMDVDSALVELQKKYSVQKDDLVPDLLVLPPGTDLHDHPLVKNGSIFLQGKASSMVAPALSPEPGWEVLDACAAPGNKTVHLAALMKRKGRIIACELKKERIKRLNDTIKLSGASNIQVLNEDFLNINPKDPSYSKLKAILLDPSCSGSGTAASRLDHLLPSKAAGDIDTERLNKLAAFQRKALEHAFLFPALERIVYSTCSINQIENEDVVKSVLPIAESYGFQLAKPFPEWQCRGLPVFDGAENLVRTDPAKHGEGFFIALFVKKDANLSVRSNKNDNKTLPNSTRIRNVRRKIPMFIHTNMFKMWLHDQLNQRQNLRNRRYFSCQCKNHS
ncbi:25S rRNA (cytosine-C(5))-methyltransferase NSUN5-like isoform X2 [Vicia villosa]|uniref:25S rRNA (cytosine-C(5))-methyltransferase NSUN5-like isoform X2 n=1 Tax=Vicia villosa TaxID=3911 RepID=UPI00273BE1E3|nr:25S rRNA (cytosine-C(5))-methyltransferase NSUN5-like isoform X2 [Vicia villosa]